MSPATSGGWRSTANSRRRRDALAYRRSTRGNACRLAGHNAVKPLAFLFEARKHRAFEDAAARKLDPHRIDEAAVDQDLVVQVRAGREAGRADKADHLPLPHARALVDAAGVSRHVAVGGFVAIGVADTDVFAVAGFPADFLNSAVA